MRNIIVSCVVVLVSLVISTSSYAKLINWTFNASVNGGTNYGVIKDGDNMTAIFTFDDESLPVDQNSDPHIGLYSFTPGVNSVDFTITDGIDTDRLVVPDNSFSVQVVSDGASYGSLIQFLDFDIGLQHAYFEVAFASPNLSGSDLITMPTAIPFVSLGSGYGQSGAPEYGEVTFSDGTFTVSIVPEPASIVLFSLAGLMAIRRHVPFYRAE